MPIRIRCMSWNLENYGTSKYNKYPLGAIIARVMRQYQIDLCALIEISNNDHLRVRQNIVAELNNQNPAYFAGNWHHDFVNVGDEGVAYIWHEEAQGANSFRRATYGNNPGRHVIGKVVKNAAGNLIYFPKTQTNWNSLPGTPDGRRPAFAVFETNDGAAPRRFSVLDIHAPFNTDTFIQAYTTHLYASSQEIIRAVNFDGMHAADQARGAAANSVWPRISINLTSLNLVGNFDHNQVVTSAYQSISADIDEGYDLATILRNAITAAVREGVDQFRPHINSSLKKREAEEMTHVIAMAGGIAATHLICAISMPTAPLPVPPNIAGVVGNIATIIDNNVSYSGTIRFKKAINLVPNGMHSSAKKAIRLGTDLLTFPAIPTGGLNAALVAGDFNIDYPDTIIYTGAAIGILGFGNNAYSAVLAHAGGNNASINGRSTRIGPTAFEGQRIYTLQNPNPLQNTTPGQANYAPVDLSSMANKSYAGNDNWINAIRTLAGLQGANWKNIVDNYADVISNAFNTEIIDDTNFYRANAYDNFFVRNATVNNGMVIDVFSELGSWAQRGNAVPNLQPVGSINPNPWAAARQNLNALATARLNAVNPNPPGHRFPITYNTPTRTVTYNIHPNVLDAEDAAVFFDSFISDHLPVAVDVSI